VVSALDWPAPETRIVQPFVDSCGRGVIDAEPCPRELGREIQVAPRRIVLAACVLASSMAFIDGSVLTVALPSLRAAIGADLATVQWVMNAYLLALAALTLIGGALADAYGKARLLAIGCLMFGAVSAACALAPSVGWLIGARAIQGVAAALVTPASLALIGAIYPKDERAGAIGVWAAASALTSAAGPVVGGWLTGKFGWHAVFWINPPVAVAAVALLWTSAPGGPDRAAPLRFCRRGPDRTVARGADLELESNRRQPASRGEHLCFRHIDARSRCPRTRRARRLRRMGARERTPDDPAAPGT